MLANPTVEFSICAHADTHLAHARTLVRKRNHPSPGLCTAVEYRRCFWEDFHWLSLTEWRPRNRWAVRMLWGVLVLWTWCPGGGRAEVGPAGSSRCCSLRSYSGGRRRRGRVERTLECVAFGWPRDGRWGVLTIPRWQTEQNYNYNCWQLNRYSAELTRCFGWRPKRSGWTTK